MTALIVTPRQIDGELAQTVDARELHSFLEVGTAFKDWIVRRIDTYDFREGQDFCSFLRESIGGRPAREYALSLAMGKELAMVERGEKGKQARAYFLECERRAKAAGQALALPTGLEARLERIEQQVATQAPKALAFDRLTDQRGGWCPREAAKLLGQKPRAFQTMLIEQHWIFRSSENGRLQAFQSRINQGLLIHRMVEIVRTSGVTSLVPQVLVTPKGLATLASIVDAIPQTHPNPKSSALRGQKQRRKKLNNS